jgi:hypothetical protein
MKQVVEAPAQAVAGNLLELGTWSSLGQQQDREVVEVVAGPQMEQQQQEKQQDMAGAGAATIIKSSIRLQWPIIIAKIGQRPSMPKACFRHMHP